MPSKKQIQRMYNKQRALTKWFINNGKRFQKLRKTGTYQQQVSFAKKYSYPIPKSNYKQNKLKMMHMVRRKNNEQNAQQAGIAIARLQNARLNNQPITTLAENAQEILQASDTTQEQKTSIWKKYVLPALALTAIAGAGVLAYKKREPIIQKSKNLYGQASGSIIAKSKDLYDASAVPIIAKSKQLYGQASVPIIGKYKQLYGAAGPLIQRSKQALQEGSKKIQKYGQDAYVIGKNKFQRLRQKQELADDQDIELKELPKQLLFKQE